MYIIGLDLSMNSTGYAIIKVDEENAEVIEKGIIKSKAKENHSEKLTRQYEKMKEIKQKYTIIGKDTKVIKELLHYSRPKTSAILGKVHGVVDLVFDDIIEYAPTTIKKTITTSGRATKEQVADGVRNMVQSGHELVFKSDDESDAIGVALTYWLTEVTTR